MRLSKIIDQLNRGAISLDDFVGRIPSGTFQHCDEIKAFLKEVKQLKDAPLLEYLLIAIDKDGADERYSEIVCGFLEDDWHDRHEDIIMLLEEIKDPDSVDCIFNASLREIEYDDGKSLQKKCIWALGAIGTSAAIEKLKLLAAFDNAIVKEAARMELNALQRGRN